MADNNFVDGAKTMGSYSLPLNPYADSKTAIKMKGFAADCCNYLASFEYEIAAGGATTTITPLTGNDSGDLRYYRVEISDGTTRVAGQLDLANPTADFIINTSSLDANASWTLYFFGAETPSFGQADCELRYKKKLCCGVAVDGTTGDTIPDSWVNVQMVMKLTSTDDAAFTLFPEDGLLINNHDTVNLLTYLDGTTELVNGGSYIFTLEMKKVGNPVVASTPTVLNNDVIASAANTVTFPYSVTQSYAEVNNAVTIETGTEGDFSDRVTYPLAGDGVVPTFYFNITSSVGAIIVP